MLKKQVEFWFDFSSPYSFLGCLRLAEKAKIEPIKVLWMPMLLGPIFVKYGVNLPPIKGNPAKEKYMYLDLTRKCAKYGIDFQKPDKFPNNSILGARVALIAQKQGWSSKFNVGLFKQNFCNNKDISDYNVVTEVIQNCGKDTESILKLALADENKQLLKDQTQLAIAKGIFGAPTFFYQDNMYWGDDRLEDFLEFVNNN